MLWASECLPSGDALMTLHMTLIAITLFLLLPRQLSGHMEDAAGCFTIPKPREAQKLYEGLSKDGRDWVVQYDVRGWGYPDLELRYDVSPPVQWEKGNKPEALLRSIPPLAYWLDTDKLAGYDEWYIDPRRKGNCLDFIHMKWDGEVWRLWIPHHEEGKLAGGDTSYR